MRECARVVIGLLATLQLAGASRAAAQELSRFGAGSFLIGAGALFQNSVVREFSSEICPGSELGAELSGGILVLQWLAASAFGRIHDEAFADECVNGLHPPPPDSGTVTFTDLSGVEGYPYLATGLRVTAFSGSPHGGALRAYVGGEWLWGKSILTPLAGLGISIPLRRVLLVAEAERRFLAFSYDRVEVTYRQGAPVGERRDEQHRKAGRWALRAGVELALPK